ncbi:GntR family transcriptional regulator [Lichenicoccus sp.]|uniref:GntR family transcriptional regulator n=1 Tax=Lichenicoccus sp. TaxID=2781899 RepID=UPI003D131AF7
MNTGEDTAVLPAREPASARVQEIVGALEEQIVLGWLMPRERLLEDRLTAQFACKKHVVREVLSELERMGLVQRVPNKGAAVVMLEPDAVRQIYSVREALETLAAEQIRLPADRLLLEALQAIQADHTGAVAAHDPRSAFRANLAFHDRLFCACENPYLSSLIRSAAQKVHGARFYSATSRTHLLRARDEHEEMIRALERGDREELVTLCRNHLAPSREAYLRAVETRFRKGA